MHPMTIVAIPAVALVTPIPFVPLKLCHHDEREANFHLPCYIIE